MQWTVAEEEEHSHLVCPRETMIPPWRACHELSALLACLRDRSPIFSDDLLIKAITFRNHFDGIRDGENLIMNIVHSVMGPICGGSREKSFAGVPLASLAMIMNKHKSSLQAHVRFVYLGSTLLPILPPLLPSLPPPSSNLTPSTNIAPESSILNLRPRPGHIWRLLLQPFRYQSLWRHVWPDDPHRGTIALFRKKQTTFDDNF